MQQSKPINILYLAIHPIQNTKPYKLLISYKAISYCVCYLLKPEMVNVISEENLNHPSFDTNVTSGYNNVFLNNHSPFSKANTFWGLLSLDVIRAVKKANILVVYGHNTATFWLAMIYAKLLRKKIILTTDIAYLEANSKSSGWKLIIKPYVLRFLYNFWSDGVFVPSTSTKIFLENTIKVNPSKIILTPYVVDEDLIVSTIKNIDVGVFRKKSNIGGDPFVFIFCAKFIDRKRPMDVLKAFVKICHNTNVFLIMIGDGPLKKELVDFTISSNIQNKILFTGFVKYSTLPLYYASSNCLVFSSEHEPYGLPVNEAMLCGIPVIVSDKIGCRIDLVIEGKTGWVYETANVNELSLKMANVASLSYEELNSLKINCKNIMNKWSSEVNVENQINYFKQIFA